MSRKIAGGEGILAAVASMRSEARETPMAFMQGRFHVRVGAVRALDADFVPARTDAGSPKVEATKGVR